MRVPPRPLAGPARDRYLRAYAARRALKVPVQIPPETSGVADAVDLHCHAGRGHHDALALAKVASRSGMGALLFKQIVGSPAIRAVRELDDKLRRWAEQEGVAPVQCFAGYLVEERREPLSARRVLEQLRGGAAAVWLPVALHANTLSKIGGRRIWFDPSADHHDLTPACSWEEALRVGYHLLDDSGHLSAEVRDIVHAVADEQRLLFFGHATHPEIFALAEEVQRIGFKRAVVDHPFSPFIDLTVDEMKMLARAGITLNFTFDEISPLLGVDPGLIYDAIRAVGLDHITLSSDAGEPLFPHSVECMRLIGTYMQAYGLTEDEVRRLTVSNPKALLLG